MRVDLKVLFAAAEAVPLVKVGGLGDVAGSLPVALQKLGVDVRLAIPWYPEIDTKKWGLEKHGKVGETRLGKTDIPVYLLAREVFSKAGEHKAILATKIEEKWFAGFSEAAIDFIAESEWKPQVLHGHDWHVTEALVRFEKATRDELLSWGYSGKKLGTVLTVHNLNYHSKVLKFAIQAADVINAVSPSYAKEILTKKFCAGLCKDLLSRKQDIYGVLNGIDYGVWNPSNDSLLNVSYNTKDWQAGKKSNKKKLKEEIGLREGEGLLLGFVGRLDPNQKGVQILVNSMEKIVGMGVQIVVLGTGDKIIEKQLKQLAVKYKGELASEIRYDERLAHLIYAGADGLVIPSKYEPCGLIQMIAMKYGTLPVAHAVGGLKDTIDDGETGFLYRDYKSRGLVRVVRRACNIFSDKGEEWERMVARAMREDFSWVQSAKEYVKLYKRAMRK